MARTSRASREKILAMEKRQQALEYRKQGLNYREIGDKMGFSEQRAWKIITDEFKRLAAETNETATDALRLTLERLDTLLAAVMPAAKNGDVKAIEASLKIIDRYGKLFGLDPAQKIQATVNVKNMNEDQLIEEAKRLGILPKESTNG
jgi:hypothetical protein